MGLLDLFPFKVTNNVSNLDATTQDSMLDAIQAVVNALVDANVDPAAAIQVSKLAAGMNGQVLTTVGGVASWGAGGTSYRKTSSKTINNSAAETDLLNGEITLAANDLGTNRVLRLAASGDFLYNTAGGMNTPRFKLKLGATTLIDTNVVSSPGVAQSASRWPWTIKATIAELGATNAQWVSFEMYFGSASGSVASPAQPFVFTTGEGILHQMAASTGTPGEITIGVGTNSATVDGTSPQALVLSATLGGANASHEIVLKHALVVIE